MSMPLFRRLKNKIKHFNVYFLLYSKTKQPNSTDKEEVVTNRLQAKSIHKHKHSFLTCLTFSLQCLIKKGALK